MRVAIITIESPNYGNRLQNYAVQTVLNKMGLNPKTLKRYHYSIIGRVKSWICCFFMKDSTSNFCRFNRLINWDYNYLSYDHIPKKINSKYDFFIIGSDQIWNPSFAFSSEVDYLPFIDSYKCVSFAASIGLDYIPESYISMMSKGLNHISSISVREDSAKRIVKDLTGKDAQVVVDPTLLLTAQEWNYVKKKPSSFPEEAYILTYFLGGLPSDYNDVVDRITKDRKLNVIELNSQNGEIASNAGPSEFVYLISHASLVLTDSFHACVFSFTFNKPFLVFDRFCAEGDMFSRIRTFLSMFHLERKYANSGLDNDIWEHDYEEGYKQLEIERKKALDFLKEVLGE